MAGLRESLDPHSEDVMRAPSSYVLVWDQGLTCEELEGPSGRPQREVRGHLACSA